MQDKIKNIIITIGFVTSIIGVFIANIIDKDNQISTAERRKLAQLPEISFAQIINGDVIGKWEDYVADQFIARDIFRTIKSIRNINIYIRHIW